MDAPDVETVIHYGPPNSKEEYVQESGRGKDNRRPLANLYHTGIDFSGFKRSMMTSPVIEGILVNVEEMLD